MTTIFERFGGAYSRDDLWMKLARHALAAGERVIELALQLYYAAESPQTPKWARAVVYGALGYFILPADAVPDVLPLAGYADDLSVLAAAAATIAMRITPEIRARARATMAQWFGEPMAHARNPS